MDIKIIGYWCAPDGTEVKSTVPEAVASTLSLTQFRVHIVEVWLKYRTFLGCRASPRCRGNGYRPGRHF